MARLTGAFSAFATIKNFSNFCFDVSRETEAQPLKSIVLESPPAVSPEASPTAPSQVDVSVTARRLRHREIEHPYPSSLPLAKGSIALIQPQSFLPFDGSALARASDSCDANDVTVFAWVRLRGQAATHTIVSNRLSGCEQSPRRAGFLFRLRRSTYGKAVLDLWWGSGISGCHSVSSEALVEDNTWAHVGFTLSRGVQAAGTVKLYYNGTA